MCIVKLLLHTITVSPGSALLVPPHCISAEVNPNSSVLITSEILDMKSLRKDELGRTEMENGNILFFCIYVQHPHILTPRKGRCLKTGKQQCCRPWHHNIPFPHWHQYQLHPVICTCRRKCLDCFSLWLFLFNFWIAVGCVSTLHMTRCSFCNIDRN